MKLKIALSLALLLLVGTAQQIMAQTLQLRGKVRSRTTGDALNGATISVKGGSTSAVSDATGSFTLVVSEKGAMVEVSYTGMKTATYSVSKSIKF